MIQCPVCHIQFTRRYNLRRHIASIHGNRVVYICDICGEQLARRDNFRLHFRRRHLQQQPAQPEPEPQPEPLPQPAVAPLRIRHYVVGQVVCTICGSERYDAYDLVIHTLIEHMLGPHPIIVEQTHQCDFCEYYFQTRARLEEHICRV